eukprot:CAMPEP_0197036330 /NCGR_PEP_ID=MMETSP1384-20130603/13872_1 /TAXON_ID=29189 /ORGANISM="Ammonia sp." /LENGTH=73 /DNA_ID=CAMNT_0042466501 /DNA_START=89 /DNA_END=310 /DNA_ORIENTATION=-
MPDPISAAAVALGIGIGGLAIGAGEFAVDAWKEFKKCKKCNGRGFKYYDVKGPKGKVTAERKTCWNCSGTGRD